jgi:hypothetical protein
VETAATTSEVSHVAAKLTNLGTPRRVCTAKMFDLRQNLRRDVRIAALSFLLVGVAWIAVSCGGGQEDSEDEWVEEFAAVQDAVNQAGFGIAQPMVDAQSCTTQEACLEAGDTLAAGFKTYNPTLQEQIDVLQGLTPPARAVDLQSLYIEQLQLRIQAGELIIEGWESGDDSTLDDGFERFRQSQAKFGEILDELQSLQDE